MVPLRMEQLRMVMELLAPMDTLLLLTQLLPMPMGPQLQQLMEAQLVLMLTEAQLVPMLTEAQLPVLMLTEAQLVLMLTEARRVLMLTEARLVLMLTEARLVLMLTEAQLVLMPMVPLIHTLLMVVSTVRLKIPMLRLPPATPKPLAPPAHFKMLNHCQIKSFISTIQYMLYIFGMKLNLSQQSLRDLIKSGSKKCLAANSIPVVSVKISCNNSLAAALKLRT